MRDVTLRNQRRHLSDSLPTRRDFLGMTALAVGAAGVPRLARAAAGTSVALVVAPGDALAHSAPVRWALSELQVALVKRGIEVKRVSSLADARPSNACVAACGSTSTIARAVLGRAGVAGPASPESLALVPGSNDGAPVLLASGHDARGLMYAVLELADRVTHEPEPLRALAQPGPIVETPFNAVRAIGRPFVSDVEDKPWYDDRSFWPAYFGMLARERVNRFHLLFGMGFDTLRWVKDAYLLFAYPFLVSVPGYDVKALNLPDAERDHNLEMLRYISHEAVAHGLDFQLGLWTHGHTWTDSDDTNYTISGLTPANQGAYCRDALAMVLRACPDITGVTLRTHYESGVKEGSYAFWKTIFDGVPKAGRTLEIELHAKGLDQRMIDGALATGMPVRVSPKYWAEHTGLPYHQADIRGLEKPHEEAGLDAFSALSFGSRNHTRYGYADFMREDRPYGVFFRVFPGTHKFLLWGDPLTAAAHARAFRFCGSDGAELFEPLSFKGRRGSGIAGGRCAYADASLTPARDWEKFLYTYRLWGRLLYNPDTPPGVWRRLLRTQYGEDTPVIEDALATATRILPLVTTAHLPSAAQDTYSPEFYTNQSIVDPKAASPYGDTPEPKDAGHVSPLDPALFSSLDEHVSHLLAGTNDAKFSPMDVARWLEDLSATTIARLGGPAGAAERVTRGSVDVRRATIDIVAQAEMGRFFASKLRAGALFLVYQKVGDRNALEQAIRLYRQAREEWARMAESLRTVYVADITFGPLPHQRGHWADRVAAMDADIAAMEKLQQTSAAAAAARPEAARSAVERILARPRRTPIDGRHEPPATFVPGAPLEVSFEVRPASTPATVVLCYRHVNQAERYERSPMQIDNGAFRAAIPAAYTRSAYPLQYYFEVTWDAQAEARALRPGAGAGPSGTDSRADSRTLPAAATMTAGLFPGFNPELTNQPYYVVRRG